MRTTVDLDEAVLVAARAIARDTNTSIGAAVSLLALRGLARSAAIHSDEGFPVFTAPPGASPITLDVVNAHRDG